MQVRVIPGETFSGMRIFGREGEEEESGERAEGAIVEV